MVTHLLDLELETSVATWYSTIKLFCISLWGGIFAYRYINRRERLSWILLALPLLFLFLSLDEGVTLHEWIGLKTDVFLPGGNRNETFFQHTGIWMFIIGIPFLIGFLLLVFTIKKYLSVKRGSFEKLILGMVIFLAGALGFEALTNIFPAQQSLGYVLMTFLEETLEMIGATVIFWAFYELTNDAIIIKRNCLE